MSSSDRSTSTTSREPPQDSDLAGSQLPSFESHVFRSGHSVPFRRAIIALLDIERGYSDHPSDPGGQTRWGIPESRARDHGFTGPIQNLPLDLAITIYEEDFWRSLRGEKIAALLGTPLMIELFEAAVHVGVRPAVEFFQKGLNLLNREQQLWEDIRTDGIVGEQTIRAATRLKAERPEAIVSLSKAIMVQKGAYYVEVASANEDLEDFFHGWLAQRVPLPHEPRELGARSDASAEA